MSNDKHVECFEDYKPEFEETLHYLRNVKDPNSSRVSTRKVYKKTYFYNLKGCETITKNVEDNNTIITFFGCADLSMLKDFHLFKDNLTLVQKNFITMKSMAMQGINVSVRDAKLLVPPAFSLDKIGKLYGGDLTKIALDASVKSNMKGLLERDLDEFKDYALRDSVITLVHGVVMMEYNNQLNDIGVPITVSTLTGKVLRMY